MINRKADLLSKIGQRRWHCYDALREPHSLDNDPLGNDETFTGGKTNGWRN